jgi:hypothetical protein
MSRINKPWEEQYRSYTTDNRWKIVHCKWSYSKPRSEHYTQYCTHERSWNSIVCIPTGLQADSPRFKSQKEKEIFSPQHSDQLWGQPSPLFNVYQGSFMGEKRLRSEVNHHLHLRCWQRKLPFAFYCIDNSTRFTATFSSEKWRIQMTDSHKRKKD